MEAPIIAKQYYENVDMYVFDEFQTSQSKGSRRPIINTLYDVFNNIKDDESSHVSTMSACQDPTILLHSPNTEAAIISSILALGMLTLISGPVLTNLGIEGSTVLTDFYDSFTIATGLKALKTIEEQKIISSDVIEATTNNLIENTKEIENDVVKKFFEIFSKFRL